MKILNQIKHIKTPIFIVALVVLLVFSPCKVRNSIQEIFEVTKTEVSNKSISSLKNRTCDISTDTDIAVSKSNKKLQLSQALIAPLSIFQNNKFVTSDRRISQYYSARDEIPPLAPYYILYKNNKAYL